MKLRCMTKTSCRPILIIFILLFIVACTKAGDDLNHSTNLAVDSKNENMQKGENKKSGQSENIVAVHNPNSSQYEKNCLKCHDDIPIAQSLEPTIPNAHVAMLGFTPGKKSEQCRWCHTNVSASLIQAISAPGPFQTNIRKHVDTQLCAICHGPVGPGKQFYQTGLTANGNPDGAKLYHYLCSACHKDLVNSEVKGESTQEIFEAIAENEGGMGPLKVLNTQWVLAIGDALSSGGSGGGGN